MNYNFNERSIEFIFLIFITTRLLVIISNTLMAEV